MAGPSDPTEAGSVSELLRDSEKNKGASIPRMASRYPGVADAVTLREPKSGLFRRLRSNTMDGELLDLSIGGALIRVPSDPSLHENSRLELCLGGELATVGVRRLEEPVDGYRLCGVAFRTTTPGFEAVVNEAISSMITSPRRLEAWRMGT